MSSFRSLILILNMFSFIYRTDNVGSSINEPLVNHDVSADLGASPVNYRLVEQRTKRGRAMLLDSLGFTYNINSKRPYATYWQCTVLPRGNYCKALVTERHGTFHARKNSPNHSAEVGAVTARKIVTNVMAK